MLVDFAKGYRGTVYYQSGRDNTMQSATGIVYVENSVSKWVVVATSQEPFAGRMIPYKDIVDVCFDESDKGEDTSSE